MIDQNRFSDTLTTRAEWFDAWLDCFGDEKSGLWQRRDDETVSVPYRMSTRPVFGLSARMLSAAANSHTPRFDILGHCEDTGAMLTEMMRDLDADALEFPYLSMSSRLATGLLSSPGATKYQLEFCEDAPYIETNQSWDHYWQSLGKSRRELGRRERKLLGQDAIRFECLEDWSRIAPEFERVLRVEASGWKGNEGSAIVQNPDAWKFYSRMARAWAEQGKLRLFVLYEGSEPVAFELDALHNGVLHCFKHGYLESHAKQGPGQVLRLQVLRWAFDEPGVDVFDMFGPRTDAKDKWSSGYERLYTLRMFRGSARGRIAWLRYVGGPALKRRIVRGAAVDR